MRMTKAILVGSVIVLAGCVTSPFLSEDATDRLAAVDALSNQRKLAEVALDYCTEPYQELPTGCQMDVRRRAVERLTDQDLLMAVASFSITKTAIWKRACHVYLGNPDAELQRLALNKLTDADYIQGVLSQKGAFLVSRLFEKALYGYYEIEGAEPEPAEDAWITMVRSKEKQMSKALSDCLVKEQTPVDMCRKINNLLSVSFSDASKSEVGNAYRQCVAQAAAVKSAIRALELAEILPSDVVAQADVEAMCRKVSSKIETVEEFVKFGALVNGSAKPYVSDPEALLQEAATKVVPKLGDMKEIAAFADVLKDSTNSWVGEIGIADAVRRGAKRISSVDGIKAFANQVSSFNSLMLPDKTDIAGEAVIAVLNAVAKDKTRRGKDSSVETFVKAVSEFDADLLSDKAIIAIFSNKELADIYRAAMRADGYRENMGNELAGAVSNGGTFGDMLAAGMLIGAMGDKESPKYTKMFAHLVKIIREDETFVQAAKVVDIYYPRNLLLEEAAKRADDVVYARCLLAVWRNFPKSDWCIGQTLSAGVKFMKKDSLNALAILQPVFESYAKNKSEFVRILSCAFYVDPQKIENALRDVDLRAFDKEGNVDAYVLSVNAAKKLYGRNGQQCASDFLDRLSKSLADKMSDNSNAIRWNQFVFSAEKLMTALQTKAPSIWGRIMLNVKLKPISFEFEKVYPILSSNQAQMVDFACRYHPETFYFYGRDHFSFLKSNKEYMPYEGYGLFSKEPVFYYNCDWYWKSLCKVSAFDLTEEDRKRLNKVMSFVVCNALDPAVRKNVYDAIVGDDVKRQVKEEFAKSATAVSETLTGMFNLCMDERNPKMKKEKLWKEKYEWKRVRLKGKVIEAGTPYDSLYRYGKHVELLVDVAGSLSDKTYVVKAATTKGNGRGDSVNSELQCARNQLKQYEDEWARDKKRFEKGKGKIIASVNDVKKKYTAKEYYKQFGFGCPTVYGKMPEEIIADQRKLVASLEKKASGVDAKFSILCDVIMPSFCEHEIASLDKGAEIIVEGFPEMIYRVPEDAPRGRGKGEAVFVFTLLDARVWKPL